MRSIDRQLAKFHGRPQEGSGCYLMSIITGKFQVFQESLTIPVEFRTEANHIKCSSRRTKSKTCNKHKCKQKPSRHNKMQKMQPKELDWLFRLVFAWPRIRFVNSPNQFHVNQQSEGGVVDDLHHADEATAQKQAVDAAERG
ncbi:hypothetical protein TcasGA2_TC009510 [Tribolium castaneum]|uniref:Uncharacterized protein n=1 Tax=Tribolium castaneum TaxID=7070 RepID=D6WRX5_TRICA|nr:hypothetical protein TcasGA2_TC009510 [Tribolium castaneum]